MATTEQNPFAEQTEGIDATRSTLCNHWAQVLQGTLFTGVSTAGAGRAAPLSKGRQTPLRVPAVPGGEQWGHRQCVLACLGAFAKGREGLPQES